MVRIFRHYLSAKLILIIGLEAMVFVLAIQLGLAFSLRASPADAPALALLPTFAFVAGMLVVMNAMGLYSGDPWTNMQSVRVRLIAAAVLVVALTFVATRLPPSATIEPQGFLATGLAIFVGITVVRFAFYRWDMAALKPRVLVLGTGPHVAEFAQLAQRNRNHMIVGYVALPAATVHYVPATLILPPGPDQSLATLVRKHGVDQIVVAASEGADTLPLQDLLECKMQGLKITELPTAFEREYRQVSLESIAIRN